MFSKEMTLTPIDAPQLPTLAIACESQRFTVGRIFCVGRNYADHAREMGSDPNREPPFFFTKQSNALCETGTALPYPPRTGSLHHEVELVVAIGRSGKCDSPADAARYIFGYAVGVDLTRRDIQNAAKAQRRPWDLSKSFDGSAPVGPLIRSHQGFLGKNRIELLVNDKVRQSGRLSEMIWPINDILVELSTFQPLAAGDLIFTGTPAGVGLVERSDRLIARIEGLPSLELTIV